ncbi:Cytochrome P450 4c3 [Halotydeus destructor]|nr:Cytochrome P450 4c3 [Halotydeus destructor]
MSSSFSSPENLPLKAFGVICSIWVLKWYLQRRKRLSTLDGMPGPKPLPLIGNLHLMFGNGRTPSQNVLIVEDELNKMYGKDGAYLFYKMITPQVILTKAETISKVLTCRKNLDKPREYHLLDKWIGGGLLISDGDEWKPNRKLLTPAFHSKIIEEFVPIINKHGQELCELLAKQPRCDDFMKFSMNCTFDAILETSMGYHKFSQGQDEESQYQKAVNEYTQTVIDRALNPLLHNDFVYFYLTPRGRRARKLIDKMHGITDGVIAERKKILMSELESNHSEQKRGQPLIDILLRENIVNKTLSDKQVRLQVETFTFAGFDTTALAISYCTLHLGHDPLIQEKLFNEILEVVGDDLEREISLDHLSRLTYLEMVIKESLRMSPSAPTVVRKLSEPIEINGHVIPEGISVFMMIHLLHRDPRHFPEPDTFDPERFSPNNLDKIPAYAYVPFSSGSRNCIGQKFAMNEIKIVVAHIVRRFKLKSLVTFDDLRLANQIVMKPTRPIKIQFIARN